MTPYKTIREAWETEKIIVLITADGKVLNNLKLKSF